MKIDEIKELIDEGCMNIYDIQKRTNISLSNLSNLLLNNLVISDKFTITNNELLQIKQLRDQSIPTPKIRSILKLSHSELSTILLNYLIANGDNVIIKEENFFINKNDNGDTILSTLRSQSDDNKILESKDLILSPPEIKLDHIEYKVKEKYILKDISFDILPGSFHAFVGENGAGKSTTIKLLVGLINNYKGDLLIDNKNTKDYENLRDGIAFVPDQTAFPMNFTVYSYLFSLTKLMTELKPREIEKDIDFYLNKFSINEIRSRNPNRCSAGQKQKLLLISALIQRPKVIILDEPFANLDPSSRYMFMEELKEYQLKYNATIFLSTHILDEIKEYADYVTFLKHGFVLVSKKVIDNNEITKLYKKHYLNKNTERLIFYDKEKI